MRIKIPKSVKIGGLTYTVDIVQELDIGCADTHWQKQRMRVQEADENFMQQVFLHEILHAINGEWEEERIEFLAMALFQVIKDNPDMFVCSKGVKK